MSESDAYIHAYLISKSNTLEFYVKRILHLGSKTSEYYFCIDKIIDMIDDVENMIRKVGANSVYLNPFFNNLVLLYDLHIPQVTSLLRRFNYINDVMRTVYNLAIIGLKKELLISGDELQCISFMLSNDLIPNADRSFLYEYYLKMTLLRSSNLPYESFKELIKQYFKTILEEKAYGGKIIFKRLLDMNNNRSYCFRNTIYLSEEDLEGLYTTGDYELLIEFFMQLRISCFQKALAEDNHADFSLILFKDDILCNVLSNYELDNKDYLYANVAGKLYAISNVTHLLKKLGIDFNNLKDPYADLKKELESKLSNEERYHQGKKYPLDRIFMKCLEKMPELFIIYPFLNNYYSVSQNGKIVLKESERSS